jgi:glucosamine 6-phosphate synthetase-like amidotransferase/phosphosugar isomerase protein
VAREIARLEWDSEAAEKGGFCDFMLKEIFEQPEAIRNSTRGRLDAGSGSAKLGGLAMTPREIAEIGRMVMVACGTSMHAVWLAVFSSRTWLICRQMSNRPQSSDIEIRFSPPRSGLGDQSIRRNRRHPGRNP